MRAVLQAALVYLLIGVIFAVCQNLLPGGPAEQVFGPSWWRAGDWWSWFVLPMLTWPVMLWRMVK